MARHVCVRIGLCSNLVASHTGAFSIQRGKRTGTGDSHGIVGGIGFGTAYIEFKKPGHHNDCLRAAAGLETPLCGSQKAREAGPIDRTPPNFHAGSCR